MNLLAELLALTWGFDREGVARGGGLELLSGLSRSVPAGSELAVTVRFLVSADPASEVLVATSLGTFVITL